MSDSMASPAAATQGSDYIVITAMKTRLVQIGNSRGVRLPKLLIEQAGLAEEVELRVRRGSIVISAAAHRAGWARAAGEARGRGEDRMVDRPARTRFDRDEWRW